MNVECVESCCCCYFCFFLQCYLPNKTLQPTPETRRRYRLPCGCCLCLCHCAGKQNKWKMNSIHYHDVKSCVVTARLPAWPPMLGGVKVPAKKYKLRVMRRAAIDGSHFLCETPAAAAAPAEADGPGSLAGAKCAHK